MSLHMSKGYIYIYIYIYSWLFSNTLFWVLGWWLMICSWYKRYSWLIVIVRDLYSWWTIFSYNLKDLSFIYREFKKITLKIIYANYIQYNCTWVFLFLVIFSWWLKAFDLVYLYFIQIYLCCSEKLKWYECMNQFQLT